MNKRKIFVWIAILIIPLSYIASIILSVIAHPLAEAFLAITLLSSVTAPMTIYAFTIFPKHMAELVTKFNHFQDEHRQ